MVCPLNKLKSNVRYPLSPFPFPTQPPLFFFSFFFSPFSLTNLTHNLYR